MTLARSSFLDGERLQSRLALRVAPIQPGAFHTLTVLEQTSFGFRLGDGSIVLPNAQAPRECAVGDALEVFVYESASGKLLASAERPKGAPGSFACLEVVDRNPHGVFMDWGLDKDLFVPRKEQVAPMPIGDYFMVRITTDKQGRVMGSTRIRNFLDDDLSEVREGQKVQLVAYETHERGIRVIVDGRWDGLVYEDDIYEELYVGAQLRGSVAKVREDAKLDIHIRPRGVAAIDNDREKILTALRANAGFLGLHDKSSPAAIEAQLHMSKKAFKRAVGGLLRAGSVRFEDGGIRLIGD